MDDDEELLLGLAAGLDLPTAAAMSADDGDDNGNGDNGGDNKGCGCFAVLLLGILVVSLAGLLIA